MVTINGTEYDGNAYQTLTDEIRIELVGSYSLATISEWGDTPTVDDITTTGLKYVSHDGSNTNVGYTTKTEAEIANDKITAVRAAIQALGDGVPTLAKLKTFLTAVKEAVGWTS